MNWQFLYKIWRPDTYIVNGQKSYLHKMTVPNRFIRISPDGTIYYSQRLTVKARCEMDLHKFPLDDQVRFCRQVSWESGPATDIKSRPMLTMDFLFFFPGVPP